MTPGAPDLVLTKPDGTVIFVEMKSSKGRLSENQKSIQNQCENISPKLYFVCRSVEEFKSLF
jgi:Holliday junction resolvase-like predicted endonuclease